MKQFGGSVTLSGRSRSVVVQIGMLGKIRVSVEGRVEFEMTPVRTMPPEIAVTLLRTPAVVRFRATELEQVGGCEIIVGGTVTPLNRLVASGRAETPEEARARYARYAGITAVVVGLVLLALNLLELQTGYYYPYLLFFGALAIQAGGLATVHPRWFSAGEATRGSLIVALVMVSCAALFSWWFVNAFGSAK